MVELRDELLTVAEAAARLKVTRHTIYRWIAEGRLPAVRYSPRVLRVRLADLDRHREARSQGAVRETSVAYGARAPAQPPAPEEEDEEIQRLMDNYRRLSKRRRRRGGPAKGTVAALFRHFGVISKEEGEELWRVIKEARDASVNDPVWSFDDPS